ncbi:MAG: FAD:protein FMN transferase [Treponema sp.]|nr:FAD:protein FMN transferase [Treponema sp.]
MDFKRCRAPFCAALFVLLLAACSQAESSRAEFVLGTVCSVTLFDQAKDRIYQDIFNRIREIENRMSVNIPVSDVSRINAAAGIEPVQVHDETFKVIERALHFAEQSGGAFDPTVEPLVSLWGVPGSNDRLQLNVRVPSQTEIDAVLPLINWRNVELDHHTRSVFLRRRGMALDLGAIAKGYAADEAAAIIRSAGVKRAIIDLGGNIFTVGVKKNKSPWRVGIQHPLEERGFTIGMVQTTEQTVVTSGVYERFFEADSVKYHHIFSPSRGYPVNNGLLSVTVICSVSMDADALSTAAFVMGYARGRALVESFPGAEAVFVFEDLSVWKTLGVNFTLTDKSFRLARETSLH